MKFNLEKIVSSKTFLRIVKATAAALVLLLVFACGILVGLEKARFSYELGDHYYHAFAGSPGFFMDRNFLNAHGSSGNIIKIDGNTVTVENSEGVEKNIEIGNDSQIRMGHQEINPSDLKLNENIVVIGTPDSQGEIDARLIRVMPMMLPPAQ